MSTPQSVRDNVQAEMANAQARGDLNARNAWAAIDSKLDLIHNNEGTVEVDTANHRLILNDKAREIVGQQDANIQAAFRKLGGAASNLFGDNLPLIVGAGIGATVIGYFLSWLGPFGALIGAAIGAIATELLGFSNGNSVLSGPMNTGPRIAAPDGGPSQEHAVTVAHNKTDVAIPQNTTTITITGGPNGPMVLRGTVTSEGGEFVVTQSTEGTSPTAITKNHQPGDLMLFLHGNTENNTKLLDAPRALRDAREARTNQPTVVTDYAGGISRVQFRKVADTLEAGVTGTGTPSRVMTLVPITTGTNTRKEYMMNAGNVELTKAQALAAGIAQTEEKMTYVAIAQGQLNTTTNMLNYSRLILARPGTPPAAEPQIVQRMNISGNSDWPSSRVTATPNTPPAPPTFTMTREAPKWNNYFTSPAFTTLRNNAALRVTASLDGGAETPSPLADVAPVMNVRLGGGTDVPERNTGDLSTPPLPAQQQQQPGRQGTTNAPQTL